MRTKKSTSKKQSDFDTRDATIRSANEASNQSIPIHHKKASESVAVAKGTFRQILDIVDKKKPKHIYLSYIF